MISHGILPILPPNCVKFVNFLSPKKLSSYLEILQFPTFSGKCRECKTGNRDVHGKSRNCHGKVMEKYFVNSVGTLQTNN